ncbi:hypothetical protein BD626DRAFT_449066 [Schizophyllum amplum]|uniref:F-box domain-containing protein n=1 Tax=Schizophyllum amplum TaxID=97359 RepID=A0A550D0E1_9AGAR|nr:hypothetical protein BD626DRAFT_449066 [Auriculariopsis ampla]
MSRASKGAFGGRVPPTAGAVGASQDSLALSSRGQATPPDAPLTQARARGSEEIIRGIHRLPPELLCAIFMMCGTPHESFSYPRDEHMHSDTPTKVHLYSQAAVQLGYVCSYWFAVTRGYPPLWTMVDASYPQLRDLTALSLCLRYSASLSLCLRINDDTPPYRRNADICQRFMRVLASVPDRWEEISLRLDETRGVLDPLLSLPPNSFTILRRASLRFRDCNSACALDIPLWKAFHTSPVLASVEWWDDPYIHFAASSTTLVHLTHISANGIRPENFMALLQACPQLEVMQVTVARAPDVFPGPNDGYLLPVLQHVSLPHLQELMLSGMRDWSRLFTCLSVPRLRRLDLSLARIQTDAVDGMLTRSAARLKMLTLHRVPSGQTEHVAALLRCMGLRHLEVFRWAFHNRTADDFDPFLLLPQHIKYYTTSYRKAETMYHMYRR